MADQRENLKDEPSELRKNLELATKLIGTVALIAAAIGRDEAWARWVVIGAVAIVALFALRRLEHWWMSLVRRLSDRDRYLEISETMYPLVRKKSEPNNFIALTDTFIAANDDELASAARELSQLGQRVAVRCLKNPPSGNEVGFELGYVMCVFDSAIDISRRFGELQEKAAAARCPEYPQFRERVLQIARELSPHLASQEGRMQFARLQLSPPSRKS